VVNELNAALGRSRMELKQILSYLERNEGYFPRAAVQEAVDHRDEIIPVLLEVLEDVARDPKAYLDPGRFIHIYAMYLLAQFRETRAYPLLVKIYSTPGDLPMDLAADVVTEDLGRILASVSDGEVGGMTALVENEEANEYVRGAAMDGLLTLVACGKRSRDEVMAYFRSLFQKFDRRISHAWSSLVCSCADLCPEEVIGEIRQAYEDGLVQSSVIRWPEVEEALAHGKEAAIEELKGRYSLITDVAEELGGWACFREDALYVGRRKLEFSAPQLDFGAPKPIRRTQPKVGRNDPCPCGSGKKFKKCCGR
jgi:hypothetical protein